MSEPIQNPTTEEAPEISSEALNTESPLSGDPTDLRDEEIVRLRDALSRSQADYANLVKRTEREQDESRKYLTAKLLLSLLPSVDHLERAVTIKDGVEGDTFVDGVRSVLAGLQKYLSSHRVEKFSSLGEEVDGEKHEVMSQ